MIDLHHLRALRAIARHPSLTAAARTLHCSQSALSHLLTDLEDTLRVTLVERDRRPLAITAAGRRLLACADVVLPCIEATEDDLRRIAQGSSGRLLISLECHSCIEWLSPALDAYRKVHPRIELDLRLGVSFDPLPALRDGAVDVVITAERQEAHGVISDPLFRYEIVGVVPARSPLARRTHLEPSDFAAQTVITYPVAECRLDLYTRFLDPAGVVPVQRRTAELTTMIVQWVSSGLGLAALPSWAIGAGHRQVAIRPLGKAGIHADLHVLRRASDRGLAHVDAFVTIVRRESFRSLERIAVIPPAAPNHP